MIVPIAIFWAGSVLDIFSTLTPTRDGKAREGNPLLTNKSGKLRIGIKVALTVGIFMAQYLLVPAASLRISLTLSGIIWGGFGIWDAYIAHKINARKR